MTAGAEAGARLLKPLEMPASPDTLLRLMHRAPLPAEKKPRVLGVDDWALRKGRTYGSILVDLEAHRVVDVLPDRSASTVSQWLQRHRGVQVITRDRSIEYARAAQAGAPKAQQVADRWHLLLNGRHMVERWLTGAHARLRALPFLPKPSASSRPRRSSFPRTRSEVGAGEESRARRLTTYQEVRRRHLAGEPLLTLSRALKLARGTVRKYAPAKAFPERAVRAPRPSLLDPHLEHLAQRHAEGCENALLLWRLAWLCVQPLSALSSSDKALLVCLEQDTDAPASICCGGVSFSLRNPHEVRESHQIGASPLRAHGLRTDGQDSLGRDAAYHSLHVAARYRVQ
jgi:hypothetical protein